MASHRIPWLARLLLALSFGAPLPSVAGAAKPVHATRVFRGIDKATRFVPRSLTLWPPRDLDALTPFLVARKGMAARLLDDWRGQEEWLLLARRLTFRRIERDEPKVYWLEGCPGAQKRTVYTVWQDDRFEYAGRRALGERGCWYLAWPKGGGEIDTAGTPASAQALINPLLTDRCALSLKPLKKPRTWLVADDGGKTVRKTFATAIVFEKKIGDALYLRYQPEDVDLGLTPSVLLDRQTLLVWIQDPFARSESLTRAAEVSLYPPPPSLKHIAYPETRPKPYGADQGKPAAPASPQQALCVKLATGVREGTLGEKEQLRLLEDVVQRGGPWAFQAAMGAACSKRVKSVALRRAGAVAVEALLADLALPPSPAPTPSDAALVRRSVEQLRQSRDEPDGAVFTTAKANVEDLGPRATPVLMQALKGKLDRTVKAAVYDLLGRCAALDQLVAVARICSEEGDPYMRRRATGRLSERVEFLREHWQDYVRPRAGKGAQDRLHGSGSAGPRSE